MATFAQPTGLYGWIQSNDGRSTGLFVGFLAAIQCIAPLALVAPLLVLDVDHAPFFDWTGYVWRYAPIVLATSILWFVAQLWWHVETVKRAVDFSFVDAEDEPRLCRITEPLIILTGLPVPFLGVIESDARNAFACGIGRKKAVVVVTRGLIDSLTDDELASVLAHELSHIHHGDIRLMAAANIFMSALTRLHARNVLRFTWVHGLLALAVPAVLPLSIAGSMIGRIALRGGQVSRLLIGSSREFIADAEAARWTQNPAALASALLKVDGHHRLASARAEDDAMMIAGDSEGTGATHPTIAQRVAALARVTGSMVFNAPAAPRAGDWTATTSRETVERMARSGRGIATQAIVRVRKGDKENFLGLTRYGTLALLATIGALLLIHENDLADPRAVAAKFDLRPIGLMIGKPVSCQLGTIAPSLYRRCGMEADSGGYRDFEGQTGTLAGYLADLSRRRAARGVTNADLNILSIVRETVRKPYLGESGLVRGITTMHPSGSAYYARESGGFSSTPPDAAVIAEIDQIGCFPGDRAPFMHGPPLALGETRADWSIARLVGQANVHEFEATVSLSSTGTAPDYVGRRRALVGLAYDIYGKPGLDIVLRAFSSDAHEAIVARLDQTPARRSQPAATTPIEKAEQRALARDPAAFIPCRSLAGRR